ncbi:hypothetical protein T484DRAFT_1779338, partial [Baffinella frigidus]
MAGLVYSLISRGATVFCEHCESTGNFQQVTRVILEKLDASTDVVTRVILEKLDASTDGPRSYAYDDATAFHLLAEKLDALTDGPRSHAYDDATAFHLLAKGGIVYLCMTTAAFPRAAAFQFLHDIQKKFDAQYSEI